MNWVAVCEKLRALQRPSGTCSSRTESTFGGRFRYAPSERVDLGTLLATKSAIVEEIKRLSAEEEACRQALRDSEYGHSFVTLSSSLTLADWANQSTFSPADVVFFSTCASGEAMSSESAYRLSVVRAGRPLDSPVHPSARRLQRLKVLKNSVRALSRRINLILRRLRTLDAPRPEAVILEIPWYLVHGCHPPADRSWLTISAGSAGLLQA
jgi:hypothetical protein